MSDGQLKLLQCTQCVKIEDSGMSITPNTNHGVCVCVRNIKSPLYYLLWYIVVTVTLQCYEMLETSSITASHPFCPSHFPFPTVPSDSLPLSVPTGTCGKACLSKQDLRHLSPLWKFQKLGLGVMPGASCMTYRSTKFCHRAFLRSCDLCKLWVI